MVLFQSVAVQNRKQMQNVSIQNVFLLQKQDLCLIVKDDQLWKEKDQLLKEIDALNQIVDEANARAEEIIREAEKKLESKDVIWKSHKNLRPVI